MEPIIIPPQAHHISRQHISTEALGVMYRLHKSGYKAYMVGGGVRDLLLGKQPKDFDVATDAHPRQVARLFRNGRVIGRRFRLVHVRFGPDKVVEVATFRALQEVPGGNGPEEETSGEEVAVLAEDNVYGTPEEDALRRDLTINGLFYDFATSSLIDYVNGLNDLRDGIIRLIGDPEVRAQEDPVRMIRAIRHAARNGFLIEPETWLAIMKYHPLLKMCPPARLHDEFLREFRDGTSYRSFRLMAESGLLQSLSPSLADAFDPAMGNEHGSPWRRLEILDERIADKGPLADHLIIAYVFLTVLADEVRRCYDPRVHRGDQISATDELMSSINRLMDELRLVRRLATGVEEAVMGLVRIRQSLQQGGIPGRMRAKAYFNDGWLLHELDFLGWGETPEPLSAVNHRQVHRPRPLRPLRHHRTHAGIDQL